MKGAAEFGVAAFRIKLLAGMALVVVALTFFGLYLAERSVTAETQHDLQTAFGSELALLKTARDIHHATLVERCRALVRKPRIHAALEDNAVDLLYPSAKDELGDAVAAGGETQEPTEHRSIGARFYRFLDAHGAVISPQNAPGAGGLAPAEESRLSFPALPEVQQNGYLARPGGEILEMIATPIVSTETGDPIAALVAGFPMAANDHPDAGLRIGMWLEDRLHMPSLAGSAQAALSAAVAPALADGGVVAEKGILLNVEGAQHMLFCERLNPGSLFPPAYEVGIYPLTQLLVRQWQLRVNAAVAGGVLLGLGILASLYISARMAAPVRQLAAVSAENRVLRVRAEEALVIKSGELERAARFSADASHQLKTPVAVLRAGLDELLSNDRLSPEVREELSLLVHQTFRLTSIIEDLLLLSRLDSGRLQLNSSSVDLTRLVETAVEDLHLFHPDAPEVKVSMPPGLYISGDVRYAAIIVQNLLENARKYGRPSAPIGISAREYERTISLRISNRGEGIPPASQESIFERFHRGAVGENIPGHGLGLNLARELARLHGGDLKLVRSDGTLTEFEVSFHATKAKNMEAPAAPLKTDSAREPLLGQVSSGGQRPA